LRNGGVAADASVFVEEKTEHHSRQWEKSAVFAVAQPRPIRRPTEIERPAALA